MSDSNITLNLEKCEFSKTTVKVLGNIVSSEGVSPDPDKIEAIVNLPAPKKVSEVNQLSKFTGYLADKTKPLRDLLSKKNSWSWGYAQDKTFKEIKTCLISPPVLALYDCNRRTKVSSDASAYGLGGVVLQQQDDKLWKPVAYFS